MSISRSFSKVLFQDVFRTLSRVFQSQPDYSKHIKIAGHSLHCHFKDPNRQNHLLQALTHHPEAPENSSGLDLYVWDESTTDTSLPPLPVDLPTNEGWHYDKDRYFGLSLPYQKSRRKYFYCWANGKRTHKYY